MKKIFSILTSLVFTSFLINSCIGDGKTSSATINYLGVVDSIKYSNLADTVWTKDIIEATTKLEVTYTPFEISDTVAGSEQYYVIQLCDYKAGGTYNKKLQTLTLANIKKSIYNAHADSLVKLGFNQGADSLPISPFTLHTSLGNLYTGTKPYYYATSIK